METQIMLWSDGKRRTVTELVCLNCGKRFLTRLDYAKRGKSKYCSRKCHCAANGRAIPAERRLGEANPNWKGGKPATHYTRLFERKFPEKLRAHRAVRKAIRNGTLARLPCETCGSTTDIHAHHDDYSRPLDVRWLCGRHHRIEHGKSR